MQRIVFHKHLCFCVFGLLLLAECKSRPEPKEQRLTVMTFNVRLDVPSDSANNWLYRKDNVCKMIAYYQPDLLGMQEVFHNQMEDLKRGLPQYTALGVGRDDGKQGGEYSPIFFNVDRFTLMEYGNFSLSEHPDTIGIKGWDASYNRIATWALLQEKSNGREFVYINTHLDNDGKIARKKGAQLILKKIAEIALGMPAIITGDFNCEAGEEPLLALEKGGMQNASTAAVAVYGSPWSFHDFYRLPLAERILIDYVFASSGTKVDRYRVIQDKPDDGFLSDHCPVLVDLTLSGS